jgi:hypothetical protein
MNSLPELVATLQQLLLAGAFLFLGLQLLLRPTNCAEAMSDLADRFQSRGLPLGLRGATPASIPDTPLVRGVLRAAGLSLVLLSLLRLPALV